MDCIPETAMMIVKQARKYADPLTFNHAEAFDLLFSVIDSFNGSHFRCARGIRLRRRSLKIGLPPYATLLHSSQAAEAIRGILNKGRSVPASRQGMQCRWSRVVLQSLLVSLRV